MNKNILILLLLFLLETGCKQTSWKDRVIECGENTKLGLNLNLSPDDAKRSKSYLIKTSKKYTSYHYDEKERFIQIQDDGYIDHKGSYDVIRLIPVFSKWSKGNSYNWIVKSGKVKDVQFNEFGLRVLIGSDYENKPERVFNIEWKNGSKPSSGWIKK